MKIYQVCVDDIEDKFGDAYFDYSDNEDQDTIVVGVGTFADDNDGQTILDHAKSLGAEYVLAGIVPDDGKLIDIVEVSCQDTVASWENDQLQDVINVREVDGRILMWSGGHLTGLDKSVIGKKALDVLKNDGFVAVLTD